MTVKVVSWFLQKQNNLVGQLKRFEIIVRHSLEISLRMTSWPPILPYYHEQRLWIRYRWAELVTLAPGLRPERRFAPLARGQKCLRTIFPKLEAKGYCNVFYFLVIVYI